MSHTQIVPFHSQEQLAIEVDGECHVAMRPIIDGIGLSWPGQYHKLLSQKEKFSCHHMVTTGADGKQYEMLCIPQHKLPGWLLGISLAKVQFEARCVTLSD